MDYTLEARTAILFLVAGNLLAAGLFLVHRTPRRFPAMYVLGRLSQALGWFLFFHKAVLPSWAWYLAGNLMIQLGWVYEVRAISSVERIPVRLAGITVALDILVVGHLLFNWATGASVGVINVSVSLVLLAVFMVPAVILIREPGASPLRRAVGGFYLLFCLINLARAGYALRTDNISLMTGSTMHSVWFLGLFALLIFGNVGYMLLLKEKDDRQLQHAANTDPLTGVRNRRSFFEHAASLVGRAADEGAPACALMFDLDHFKRINDSHGHAAGDRVLQAFSACASGRLRPWDVFGRIGGEEFCALLRADADASRQAAERIRIAVEELRFDAWPQLRCTVSIGLAFREPAEAGGLEAMVQEADDLLYAAKRSGRNRVLDARVPADSPLEP